MKCIASLEADYAAGLQERLKTEAIPFQVQTVTHESGLDYSDILVADEYFDRACDIAEAWSSEQMTIAQSQSNRHCPACGSINLEYTGADSFGVSVWKCKDCGNGFAR